MVNGAINYHKEGIIKLLDWTKRDVVSMNVYLYPIEPSDKESMNVVAALNPHTISWNNVCDYYQANLFHDMARSCSGSNTVHSAYSMNWPKDVKGTKALDLMVDGISPTNLETCLGAADDAVKKTYEVLKCDHLLMWPPIDDPRNIIDTSLYQTWVSDWVDEFFRRGGIEKSHFCITHPPMYSVLARANSTVGFIFTYDKDIKLHSQANQF